MNQSPESWGLSIPEPKHESPLEEALSLVGAGLQLVALHAPILQDGQVPRCTCARPNCTSSGKHPIVSRWQTHTIQDEIAVRDAFASHAFAINIGLVLGLQPSGAYLVGIDIDDAARFAELEELLGPLPLTATSKSGRGEHRFYWIPTDVDRSRLKNITGIGGKPGVDMKGARGQVVAPPSMHANGHRYRWVRWGEIVALPASWLLEVLAPVEPPKPANKYTASALPTAIDRKREQAYLQKCVTDDAVLISRSGKGLRNTTFYNRLCSLLALCQGRCRNVPGGESYVIGEFRKAARASGLGSREVEASIRSAQKWVTEQGITRGDATIFEFPTGRRATIPPPTPVPPDSEEPPDEAPTEPGHSPPERSSYAPAGSNISLLMEGGKPVKCAENVARMLEKHPAWLGGPRLDRFRMTPVWREVPEPLKGIMRNPWNDGADADALALQGWLLAQPLEQRVAAAKDACLDGLMLAANRNHFDSLVDRVSAFPQWDGVPRLDTWLHVYFGAVQTPGMARLGRVWLIASIARVFNPGCMVDVVPILESPGRQRIGKNRAINALYGDAPYVQTPNTAKVGENKELDRTASTAWCIHDDESKLFNSKNDSVKAWITRTYDTYRIPWDRSQSIIPRRAVVVCSTNQSFYFSDDENARFFPIRCGEIDVEGLTKVCEQLLAEAIVAFRSGEKWFIPRSDEIWRELSASQDERKEEDGMLDPVRDYLDRLPDGSTPRSSDILDTLDVEPKDRTTFVSKRLRTIMFTLKWEYVPMRANVARLPGEPLAEGVVMVKVWRKCKP
jgi:predicted P-loop ATPase